MAALAIVEATEALSVVFVRGEGEGQEKKKVKGGRTHRNDVSGYGVAEGKIAGYGNEDIEKCSGADRGYYYTGCSKGSLDRKMEGFGVGLTSWASCL